MTPVEGVPQNDTEAVRWYRKAAEPGGCQMRSPIWVYMYDQWSKAFPRNDIEAIRWYRMAAEQGISQGAVQSGLHVLRHRSKAFPKTMPKQCDGIVWPPSRGYAIGAAQSGLFVLPLVEGIPKDYVQAYAWYDSAAAQGDETAKGELGNHHKKNDRLLA